ncbi:MAG TPA: radical SAM protein [Bacteroidales bacterium]|nr:radical SAM protein [Bacteroidales bacterium]HOL98312.1 radical SAM protein [Bacteroidales bacterium]HOM36653.1 radical SAM protein [Bacteroidales bacterium]HPD24054.1 radical SAM protein [Bacteroidales bacterium]HRT00080.1 radical SAM protein [Bacteroidales bacterium]
MIFGKRKNIKTDLTGEELSKITNKRICNAPFSALYFHPNGQITACCLNKNSFYYGHYPENNLKQILNSIPRKLQQEYVSAGNFQLGCKTCLENIKANNFSGLMLNIYNPYDKKTIQRIDFELSHFCNLDCIMCLRDKTGKSDNIYDVSFFSEIKTLLNKLKFTNFVGGEPFLIKEYYKIWYYLLDNNPQCEIYVQTNGTILNDEIKRLLQNKNFRIGISIDAVNKETYEKIRRKADFEKTIENFEYFNSITKRKNQILQISVCPIRFNRYEIHEIIKYFDEKDCVVFFNTVDFPKNLSLKYFNSAELQKLVEYYSEIIKELKLKNDKNKSAFKGFLQQLKNWHQNSISREAESVIVLKEEIIANLRTIETKYSEFYNEILKNLPNKWYVDKIKYKEIQDIDYESKINQLLSAGKTKVEIINIAKEFFELYPYENLD